MVQGGEVTATESAPPDTSAIQDARRGSAPLAVEIVVRWGDWVLSAHELFPLRPFVVGEDGCDVLLPAEVLGAPRVPILITRWDGDMRLIVGSTSRVLLGGQKKRMSAARCVARGLGQSSTEIPGAAEVQLLPGQTATLFFQSVAIDVRLGFAAPRTPRAMLLEKRAVLAQVASFFLHLLVLGLLSFFGSPRYVDNDEGISDDQKFELQQRLERAAEAAFDHEDDLEGYKRRGRRNERRLIAALAAKQDEWMEFSSRGWSDELAAVARRDEGSRSTDTGVIGVLYDWPTPEPTRSMGGSTPRPVVPLRTVTLPAETVSSWRPGPRLRMGAVTVSGRLPPEVIQRIVRQNFGRFRLCYENGLINNPNLIGRVTVRFVIGQDGAISNVSNGGSDLPDSRVVSCIVRAFYGMSFPQPEGGIVTVVYPIMMTPGE